AEDPLQPKRCAKLLGALAAPERLQIICLLRDGPRNVSALAELLGTSVVNVSHHLGVLQHAGLVRGAKQGRFVPYHLAPQLLRPEGGSDPVDLGCCRLEIPKPEL